MPYKYKINKIAFNDGTEIYPSSLTVIVGPNNCGKSRILKDLHELITRRAPRTIVVNSIDFPLPDSFKSLKEAYDINPHIDSNGDYSLRPFSPLMRGSSPSMGWGRISIENFEKNIDSQLQSTSTEKDRIFSEFFGNFLITDLQTQERLTLANEASTQNMYNEIGSPLHLLYLDQTGCDNQLNRVFKDAFGLEIRLDESGLNMLTLRIGSKFEDIPSRPKEARPILSKYEKIDDQGDGIKSFVATVLALLLVKRPITLIDEPEAFLHSPQALKLGEFIADYATNEFQTIIVTHSSDLLRGIISKRQDVLVIRIDRFGNNNKR